MIEGLLIRKNLYQDRHIIGNLLLRNGKSIPVIFYGAQPGKTSRKSKILDIGCLYQVTAQPGKKYSSMIQTREWIPKWSHQSIRVNFKKYSLLCFGLELMSKFCIEEETNYAQKEIFTDEFEGSFKVISNFIFELEKNEISSDNQVGFLLYFLGKIFIELGIFPDLSNCQITGNTILHETGITLRSDLGGFVLNNELEEGAYIKRSHSLLKNILASVAKTQWKERPWENLNKCPPNLFHDLIEYLSFQLNMNLKSSLKSYPSLKL